MNDVSEQGDDAVPAFLHYGIRILLVYGISFLTWSLFFGPGRVI